VNDPARYWSRTRRLTLALLLVWLVVTLLAAALGPVLSIDWWGWPLGFWFGAQGALLLFLGIVVAYVWGMERIERAPGDEPTAHPPADSPDARHDRP
jgi:putative solute:sodium symporter small subunit